VPEFAPTGSAGYLLDRYRMPPEGIAEAARALIKQNLINARVRLKGIGVHQG
jgi:hypothetical protein